MKRFAVALLTALALAVATPAAAAPPPSSTTTTSGDVVTISGSTSNKSPTWKYGVQCYAGAVQAKLTWSSNKAPSVSFSAYRTKPLTQLKDDPRSTSGTKAPLTLSWPSTSPEGIYMFTVTSSSSLSFTLTVTCDRTK